MSWPHPDGIARPMRDIERAEPRPRLKLVRCEKCGGQKMPGGPHAARLVQRDGRFLRVDCVGDAVELVESGA